MKKDYVYQDKGQFKLLQNATRIGGFYAGDQGVVPAERVLPEQRFAHQPIFRRPPEAIQEMAYIPHYVSGEHIYPVLVKFGKNAEGDVIEFHTYFGGMEDTLIDDDTYLQRKFILRYKSTEEPFWNERVVESGPGLYPSWGSSVVWENKHLWQTQVPWGFPGESMRVYYARLTTPKKGRGYAKDFHNILPSKGGNHQYMLIFWVYTDDNGNFRLVIYEDDSILPWPQSQWLREYSSPNPEGPWVETENSWNVGLLLYNYWDTSDITPLDILVRELATFVLSKSHSKLEFGFTGNRSISNTPFRMEWIQRQAFKPPWFISGHNIFEDGGSVFYYLRWKNKDIIQIDESLSPPKAPTLRTIIRHGGGTFTEKVYAGGIGWYDHVV